MARKNLLAVFLFFFIFVFQAEAKVLPRFKTTKRAAGYAGVVVSPRLRADHHALEIYFGNVNRAKSIAYTLSYQTNGVEQGVIGSIDTASGATANRELLFGTCSSGVCRFHENLANMKLEVTAELTTGKKSIRRFRIKI
ncbi:hypothetical protein HY214_00455 [Candidatus Roizmanbacteria bacterium]|nr:hypothetical protein [Candidatus Roizmanbacteria bacterium]